MVHHFIASSEVSASRGTDVHSALVCAPQIVSRYDIILILEVVDKKGKAVKTFRDALKALVSAELPLPGL